MIIIENADEVFQIQCSLFTIDQDVTRSIMEQVMINSNGEETEVGAAPLFH